MDGMIDTGVNTLATTLESAKVPKTMSKDIAIVGLMGMAFLLGFFIGRKD